MRNIIDDVKKISETCSSWAEFRELVFGENGIIADYYPNEFDRQEFYYSADYQVINRIGFKVMDIFNV